jgi:hypothetical protein
MGVREPDRMMGGSCQRCRRTASVAPEWMGRSSLPKPPSRRRTVGNQAMLRAARGRCTECEDEHADRTGPSRSQTVPAPAAASAPAVAPPPSVMDVWGFQVTQAMCGCRARLRGDIAWANTAAATYAACDVPANPTSTEVEACFDAAQPGTTVAGSTSASGAVSLPPATNDPCKKIENRATAVHETMHQRTTDAMARRRGAGFWAEWRRLAGRDDRIDQMRLTFPVETDAYLAEFHNGHEWAIDEVNSYRWERRFLEDALRALNTIC